MDTDEANVREQRFPIQQFNSRQPATISYQPSTAASLPRRKGLEDRRNLPRRLEHAAGVTAIPLPALFAGVAVAGPE